MEGALKNGIVICLVEVGVGVCLCACSWVLVSLCRPWKMRKKEVDGGKVIPRGKGLWCLELQGTQATHTFHSLAPA